MKGKQTATDLINLLAQRAGITKKLAAEVIRAIPEVIEEGLINDGEAKVRNLGTFRMKRVAAKKGRNPKTGEEVVIPPHEKLVFLPEESFKEQMNEEFKYLGIKVLGEEVDSRQPTLPSGSLSESERGNRGLGSEGGEAEAFGSQEPETRNPSALPQDRPGVRDPESGTVSKKRNYWIIPLVIIIVAALSVVFYWRNFRAVQQPEQVQVQEQTVAMTKEEATALNNNPGPETLSPESGNRNLETSAVGNQQSAVIEKESETQHSTLNTQHPTLNTDLPTANVTTHLFQLAREVYGNPFLWVLIYRANQDKIKDPDVAVSGESIFIPALEGTAKRLTHNDSLAVADGYRLVYEYYLDKGDARAEEFRLVMEKYQPK